MADNGMSGAGSDGTENGGWDESGRRMLPTAPDDLAGVAHLLHVAGLAAQYSDESGAMVALSLDGERVDASALDRPGSGYDRHFRDSAYVVWAWGAGRSYVKAARALGLSERTLRNWSRADGWVGRFAVERLSVAPSRYFEAAAVVLASYGVDAAEYLGRVASGDEPNPDKVRVAAALGILDRLGLAPVRAMAPPTVDTFTGPGGVDAPAGAAPSGSPASLMDRARGRG